MITCPKCTKENQDHYKFCLGCGAELPRDASPKKFSPGTPPHGVPAVKGSAIVDETTASGTGAGPRSRETAGASPAAVAAPPAFAPPAAPPPVAPAPPPPAAQMVGAPAVAHAAPPVICPECEHPNPSSNKFCASCGFKLAKPAVSAAPAAAAPVAAPVAPQPPPATSIVLTALRADGSEAGSYGLPATTATIGRETGGIFAGDAYLSPRHATFSLRGGRLFVHDEGSLNGIYRKLRREEPVAVQPGDVFRIGQEILRVEPLAPLPPSSDGVERLGSPAKGYVGRVALIIGRDATGNAYPIPETGLHIGRERGEVLFPEDGYVSGLHCRVSVNGGQLYLTDLGSSNGSFLRLQKESEVVNGDTLLMGQQLFRITL